MGSYFEINDTLQLSQEQGFPAELDYQRHLSQPFKKEDFVSKVFAFRDKPALRIFHTPPVRVFLVQNFDGKWLYWGTIQVLSVQHDYLNKTTSGTYRIKDIFTPEEMQQAYRIVDDDAGKSFFDQ